MSKIPLVSHLHGDRDYIEKRNRLIRHARAYANKLHGRVPPTADHDKWNAEWSKTFHYQMGKLAYETGLVDFFYDDETLDRAI